MKKRVAILVALLVLLGGGALTILVKIPAPSVSFKFLNYTRSPDGAMLRLTNGTPSKITYLAEQNGLPAGAPILRMLATSNGWSDVSTQAISTHAVLTPTGGFRVLLSFSNPASLPKQGEILPTPQVGELSPGGSMDFFIRLKSGDPPVRIGTFCWVSQARTSRLLQLLQPVLGRLRIPYGMNPSVPVLVEVWCPASLQLPLSSQPNPALTN